MIPKVHVRDLGRANYKPTWDLQETLLKECSKGKWNGKGAKATGICIHYNRGNCNAGAQCRFEHKCNYVTPDGKTCPEKHPSHRHH